ncbi:VWA domain-containing protein [Plantactinospora sp. KBS50]|uniref:vWA domain-containing protein n=1 Tax=Plantactinospora sp. KBS50 TaxID=2024580 RepID=UPI0018DF1ABD|nr:VWA domain-containing protein [Plantactinospora sp. KBS50]
MVDAPPARVMAQRPRPLPVLILADVSGSMADDGKIGVLNQAVATMIRAFAAEDSLRGELWAGVVTFGGRGATLHHPLAPASEVRWQDMSAAGRTPLGAALDVVTDLLADDAFVPRRAFRPTLVLVSDGIPTDQWQQPLVRLLASERGAKALRLAVGVGQEMDGEAFAVLDAFIDNPLIKVGRADEVHELTRYFDWVTATVTTQVRSGRITNDDLMGFMN